VLRTLAPLNIYRIATVNIALDLHVLSTPPAFVLSQNQTLRIFKNVSLIQLLNHQVRFLKYGFTQGFIQQPEGRLFNSIY
jgi:hypothetical protein